MITIPMSMRAGSHSTRRRSHTAINTPGCRQSEWCICPPWLPDRADAGRVTVGAQIVTSLYADRTAIDLAEKISQVTGGFQPPPAFT